MLTMRLLLLLVLYSITGTIASAVDLIAGEKERDSLELLLITKVNRISLLWGEFLAITILWIALPFSCTSS